MTWIGRKGLIIARLEIKIIELKGRTHNLYRSSYDNNESFVIFKKCDM